ncbi:hypothetical protein LAZ67_2005771 [Cordylochernes scorpioides]|uniref:RNA-directed DNA polymerase n=1 Tax=Cordylochernes scorpioides TaxID=51811 RepID=A0ABY6K4P8_9ARAC|nr:hypothetical protein LAZ67_2005771 [Cordylochernes scorpioides]
MGKLSIPLKIGQISRRENFHVVNAPLPFGILSINSLHKFRLTIDFNKCTIFQLGAPLSTPSYHFNKVPNVCTYWQCQAMSQRPHHTTKSSAYDNHCVHSLKNTPLPTCPFFTKANCPFYMPSNNQVTTTSTCKHAQNAPTQRDNSHTKHIGDHTPSHNYHMTKPHNELDTPIDTQQNPLPHACYNTTSNTHYTPQFTTLLQRYTHIFTQNKFNVPCLRIPPVKIPTNSEKIITIRPYRVPICDQQEIRHQIQQMLENGIIEQSFSPFSSPVTLVTKRDKTKRFCIDYRKVNELISSDVHPLPRIEDILDRLAQAKYFSTADISSAYWQVPIHPDSRPLLAFATLEGLYQPTRLPFGLKTSPQIYERAISQVLQRHGLDCVAHYFDDFIIYSNTLEEHQNHLRQFFAFCEAEKLQLNFVKCEFFKQSIDFLGYTITAGTITPLTRNTDIIHAIKQPHNRKTLQSFLGDVNVYNKFIPEYARLRAPLNNLLKKDVVWNWNEVCQKAFIDLKGKLTQHPILHLYKEGLPCQVYCDASTLGIAGILKQVHPDGNVYPVQYFSRTLRPHEKNYSISELECLAIVESVEKFRIYLMGRKFTIFSDHHALQWLKTIKNPSGRLFRWSLRLSSYEYEVRYIKGKLQYEADLLSRNPFCGFLDATLIKTHQPPPSKESSLTIDHNGLHTVSRKGVTKIIIPKPLIQQLLQTVHTQYNHPGISQMSRLISTQYYWQGMSKDIKQKVKTCPTCQLTKRPLGPTYGELSQPPEAKEPFDLLSLDTIAGFAKYGNTKIYLHVVVDHFSRYAWTFSSKSTSIITYQQVLKRVLQDGSPKRLLTDRAPAFTSPKFRSFLLNRNIHPLLTTSNNPQANGLCERLNATLTGKLRLLHLENPKIAWTKLVKRVTIIYNKTPHSTTGFPPIYLMFGILPPELSDHSTPYPDIDKARKIAHTRTQNKHLQDKNIYDQRHKQPHFEVGDLVAERMPYEREVDPYFAIEAGYCGRIAISIVMEISAVSAMGGNIWSRVLAETFQTISFEFVVMLECSHDIIFGWEYFKATEAVFDCGRNELNLGEFSALESREEENQRLFASDDFVFPFLNGLCAFATWTTSWFTYLPLKNIYVIYNLMQFEKTFEVLKTELTSEPVLGHFNESADTHLHTDTNGHCIGAVLLQIQGGKEQPIAFAFRSLTKSERQKKSSGPLARWALKFQEFEVTVIYKNGCKHKDAYCQGANLRTANQVMSLTYVDIEQTKHSDLAKLIDHLNFGYAKKKYSIIDSLLYKKNYNTTERPWLRIIPKHLRSEVMADLHDDPTAGHLGFALTYDKVKKQFYWPGLYRTVHQYSSNPERGAIEIAKLLIEEVVLKHGAPREMITERGKCFISQVIKEINALCGIGHRFTTAYHPQTNGLTERFNKTLGHMLTMYTDEISDNYVGELVTRAEEVRQLSRSRLLQSQAKDRRLYDQNHTPVYYQKDDLVYFGPYKVTKKLSGVMYEVEPVDPLPRSRKTKDVVHVIRMKPCLEPEEQHYILLRNTSRDRHPSRTRAERSKSAGRCFL